MVRFHRGSTPNPATASLYRLRDRRLHNVSTAAGRRRLLEQVNSAPDRRGTQMHVALRRADVLMPRQLLDRPRRRPAHRLVRTERVAKHVRAVVAKIPDLHQPHEMMALIDSRILLEFAS